MNKEKVRINILLERNGHLFLSKLFRKGFEPKQTTFKMNSGKINYVATGLYPGTQEEFEIAIDAIKDELGPVTFTIEADWNQDQGERFKDELCKLKFKILQQIDNTSGCKEYTVEFDGSLFDAVRNLNDINYLEMFIGYE